MEDILQKTYFLNEYFQNSNIDIITSDDICRVLSKIFYSNVYIIDTSRNILGSKISNKLECNLKNINELKECKINKNVNDSLLLTTKTRINIINGEGCIFKDNIPCNLKDKYSVIVPIVGGGKRVATILLNKFSESFNESDLIIFEYISTIVGICIYRESFFKKTQEIRDNLSIEKACEALSKTEKRAIYSIIETIKEEEGIIIVSEVAKKSGITRSIIVNALKKLESAGAIKERSLGSKGTYIKIINCDLKNKFTKVE